MTPEAAEDLLDDEPDRYADDERWPRALREAEQRCERVERERDEAVALLERVCANEHDWGALETAMRDARKWLAKAADPCAEWSDSQQTLDLEPEAVARIVELVENPPAPSPALVALMRGTKP